MLFISVRNHINGVSFNQATSSYPVRAAIVVAEQRHIVDARLEHHVMTGAPFGLQLDRLLEQPAQTPRWQHHAGRQIGLQAIHYAAARDVALALPGWHTNVGIKNKILHNII